MFSTWHITHTIHTYTWFDGFQQNHTIAQHTYIHVHKDMVHMHYHTILFHDMPWYVLWHTYYTWYTLHVETYIPAHDLMVWILRRRSKMLKRWNISPDKRNIFMISLSSLRDSNHPLWEKRKNEKRISHLWCRYMLWTYIRIWLGYIYQRKRKKERYINVFKYQNLPMR